MRSESGQEEAGDEEVAVVGMDGERGIGDNY
jgi:hypothetical protein